MSSQKRILIVDQLGDWGQKEIFPADNEVVVVSTAVEAFERLKVTYDDDQINKEVDEALHRAFTAFPMARAMIRQSVGKEVSKKYRSVPFDAVLTDFWQEDGHPIGFSIATTALLAGSPYVGIWIKPIIKEVGREEFVPDTLNWLNDYRLTVNGRIVGFIFADWECLGQLLIRCIVANYPNRESQVQLIPLGFDRYKPEMVEGVRREAVDEIWPGLLKSNEKAVAIWDKVGLNHLREKFREKMREKE